PDPIGDQLAQRLVAPGQVRREHHLAAVQVDKACCGDTHSGDLMIGRITGDDLADHTGDRCRVLGRRLTAPGGQHRAVLGHYPGGDLGAADVDPDGQAHDSSQVSVSRLIFSTGPVLASRGTWVASTPAAACISELAATARCALTSGLVART